MSCGKSENITPKSEYTILRFSHNRTVLIYDRAKAYLATNISVNPAH